MLSTCSYQRLHSRQHLISPAYTRFLNFILHICTRACIYSALALTNIPSNLYSAANY